MKTTTYSELASTGCDFCGEKHPFRLIPFWDWPGKVKFLFCTPQCRKDAEKTLNIKMIDEIDLTQRRK